MNWGMSQEEVLASEDAEPVCVLPGNIMYNTKMFGLDMTVIYQFVEVHDQLSCVGATVQNDLTKNKVYGNSEADLERASRVAEAIDDYDRLKAAFKQELGEPLAEDIAYENDEWVTAIKSSANIPVDYLNQHATDDTGFKESLAKLGAATHSDAEMSSLMKYTRWQSEATDTTLVIIPTVFGGVHLQIGNVSRRHARYFPGHRDGKPPKP